MHRAARVLEVVGLWLAPSLKPTGDANGLVAAISRNLIAAHGALFRGRTPLAVVPNSFDWRGSTIWREFEDGLFLISGKGCTYSRRRSLPSGRGRIFCRGCSPSGARGICTWTKIASGVGQSSRKRGSRSVDRRSALSFPCDPICD